jgi:hypothetical protein
LAGVHRPPLDRCVGTGVHNRQCRASRVTIAAGTTSVPQSVAYAPRGSPSAAAATLTRCAVPLVSMISTVAIVRRCGRWRPLLCRPMRSPLSGRPRVTGAVIRHCGPIRSAYATDSTSIPYGTVRLEHSSCLVLWVTRLGLCALSDTL